MSNTKLWTEEQEKSLKNIRDECFRAHKIHHNLALQRLQIYDALMISLLIISPLSSTISAIGLIPGIFGTQYTAIIASTLGFGSTILASMVKFGKYDDISNTHKSISTRFLSLGNNIERQLILKKEDRQTSLQYITYVTKTYDEICQSAPLAYDDYHNPRKSPPISTEELKNRQEHHQQPPINSDEGLLQYEMNRSSNALTEYDNV
jgi:multisubunit Na+/H+ antiporter MnhG subunit